MTTVITQSHHTVYIMLLLFQPLTASRGSLSASLSQDTVTGEHAPGLSPGLLLRADSDGAASGGSGSQGESGGRPSPPNIIISQQ